ncbi:hypothetical protein HID58_092086 [Brassica napus]|uniref:Uncharacterized protein n=1 Tax=Brassica napus TaxID=3708 RepID=A0ABQ7WXK5_BRANA|nr:hypothetical protein HID58_092086 [Brassica napus]
MDEFFGYDPVENQYKVFCKLERRKPLKNLIKISHWEIQRNSGGSMADLRRLMGCHLTPLKYV